MKFIQSLCVTISKDIMLGFVQTGNSEQIVYKSGNFSKLLVLGSWDYSCVHLKPTVSYSTELGHYRCGSRYLICLTGPKFTL